MKTSSVSLLLGVSVLLLMSGLTVSTVSLNISPNLQQFFSGDLVSLSCAEDGQTVDRWTVKRTRGRQTEECGSSGSSFGRFNGSSCIISTLSVSDSTLYWCETSSGQSRDQINITVTDGPLSLQIPALPVVTGSDVTLCCRKRNDGIDKAFFYSSGNLIGDQIKEFTIHKVQQSHEGLYSCAYNEFGQSPESRLRVRDPPTTSAPQITTTLYTATSTATANTDPPGSSSPSPPFSSDIIVPIIVLGSLFLLVLLILVLVGRVQLRKKQTERNSSSPPVDVTYADVNIRQAANRKDPVEVTYSEIVIKNHRKAGRTEQPFDPDVVYSSVRAENRQSNLSLRPKN